jgi:hypothetical protein
MIKAIHNAKAASDKAPARTAITIAHMKIRLVTGAVGGETNSPLMVISNSGGRRSFMPRMWRAVGSGSSPVLLGRRIMA